MEHCTATSADFLVQGRKHIQELGDLITDFQPYSKHPFFQPLIPKAKALDNVQTNTYKSGASYAKADTVTSPSIIKTSGHPSAPFKLKTPTFSGKVRDFQGFYNRFTDLITTHAEYYTNGDKCCLLSEAMEDRQIKSLVDKFAQGPSGYDTAMEELRICYGRAFPTYVKELVQPDTYDYTQESALRVLDRTQHLIAAMEKLKGATLSQVDVALVVMDFDEEMSKEWSKHLGSSDTIPKVEELVKFITPLTRNLPSKKTSAPPTASAKQTHVKKEEHNKPSSTLAKNSCPLCKGSYHTLARCSTFMDSTPGQR